jgi:hypothetical protein
MSNPVSPLDPNNPNNPNSPLNSVNSQDPTSSPTQSTLNNLQTLTEILNDPSSSKDEKSKLVDAILKNIEQNLSSMKGAISPAITSNIKECVSMAPSYVQSSDFPEKLAQTISQLQTP